MMRVLITGATGMLGSSLMLTKTHHDLWGIYLGEKPLSNNIQELDITNEKQVEYLLTQIRPNAIIHTAAITNVDLCEDQPDFARDVHVNGTRHLINICKKLGAYFVYISTDSVFDGEKGNYTENDDPNPLNMYAITKYEGELEVLQYKNSSVIRTNIYGYNWLPKSSISEWILNTLRKNEKINLFRDVYFSPILVNNLAEILLEIVEKKLTGVYHIAGPEYITKLEFGKRIAEIFNLNEKLIIPISVKVMNFKAPRPLNPTLNCSKIQKVVDTKLLNINEGLMFFKKLQESGFLNDLKNL